MKPQNPSFTLVLLAQAFACACGGATEINYVEESGGTAGVGDLGGAGGNDVGGAGGSNSGGSSNGGTAGDTTSSGGSVSTSSGGASTSSGGASTSNGGSGGSVATNSGGSAGSVATSTGGTAGNGGTGNGGTGNGGSGGDPGCLATGCPAGEYCDGETRECNALKAPGEACGRTQECDDLLDCLDGVCCNDDECPACLNCGSDGECSVAVTDTADDTGNECTDELSCDAAGACKLVLGQTCVDDDECVSAHCVDGVCCGESECGECLNCGTDGACSVPVQGADDVTSACNGITTCDSGGECTARWSWVTSIDVIEAYIEIYSTSVGSVLYFANDGDYHIGYDTASGTISSAPLNDDYCWCGYTGAAVSDGTTLFYFANDGRTWTPGVDPAWVDVPGYTTGDYREGEGAVAVTEGRVWRMGGRSNETRLYYYDIATGAFVSDGLATYPSGGDLASACGGAVNGKIYAFGWDDGGLAEYDPGTNIWTQVDSDPNAPVSCWGRNVPAWGSYLLYAAPDYYTGTAIHLFDSTRLLWEATTIPLPDVANLTNEMVFVVGDTLYASGYNDDEQQIHIYEYVLDGFGNSTGT